MTITEAITACVALLLAALVLSTPAACTANRHIQIARAIEAGADPIEAKCAIEGDTGNTPACILAAARRKGTNP